MPCLPLGYFWIYRWNFCSSRRYISTSSPGRQQRRPGCLPRMARAAPHGISMILTVPCCTFVCNRQMSSWYRYIFSLSYFSQIYSKGDYPNLISNSPMYAQEKIFTDKQTSYHTMLEQLITSWAALHSKPQNEQTNEFTHIGDPSWFSVRKLFFLWSVAQELLTLCQYCTRSHYTAFLASYQLKHPLGLLAAMASGMQEERQVVCKHGDKSCNLGLQSGESKPTDTSPGLCRSVLRWELDFIHPRDSLALPECTFLQVRSWSLQASSIIMKVGILVGLRYSAKALLCS